jgi:hypothetical protein
MYCVIKCVKTKRVLEHKFASTLFHNRNVKMQKTQICVTGPQCVKWSSDTHGRRREMTVLSSKQFSVLRKFLFIESVWILSFPFHVTHFYLIRLQIDGNFMLLDTGENCVLQTAGQE